MKIGIGLPAAVPGTDMTTLGRWAAHSERAGFEAVGVIDRLVYDNLEPLIALSAAAARTTHVELITTVLNVGWRNNPVLLAKQLASVEQSPVDASPPASDWVDGQRTSPPTTRRRRARRRCGTRRWPPWDKRGPGG
jgi:hypothetical protein